MERSESTTREVSEKKKVLYVRCSEKTFRRFRSLAATLGFTNHEKFLIYLIDRLEAGKVDFERYKPK